jgi:hypothetical protein
MDTLPATQHVSPQVSWKVGVIWMGAGFPGLLRLLARNRWRMPPASLAGALFDLSCGLVNSTLGVLQQGLLGRAVSRQALPADPVFVVGHWRCGTTLLHELLALDPRHRCPTTYECFAPHHFLLSDRWLKSCIRFLLPANRWADDMPMQWDLPQEDEFALCNLGIPSPYWTIAFPNEPPQFPDYFELDRLSPTAQRHWQQALERFLKQLTWKRPGRIVLKSPTHTFRLPTLQGMFPQARYIHLVRNPYDVFSSTMRLWKSLYAAQGYQRPTCAGLETHVLDLFCRLHQRLEATRGLIDPHRFCDVRYEDLIHDPVGQLRHVYQQLDLGDFEPLVPAIEAYFRQRTDHRPNRHELAPHEHAAVTQRWLPYLAKYGYQ